MNRIPLVRKLILTVWALAQHSFKFTRDSRPRRLQGLPHVGTQLAIDLVEAPHLSHNQLVDHVFV
eukprot:CAMPEP_0115311428 /NCGR_PEP_ID=MMETSP0270-20121206/75328_1 /TAXON_ID=71861 /ORGANISM="Scrippsiella trochoidea, Strain CCMP3099" /LENGTH=64 /DNA_ID=CAMNT_0002730255 /DNA_START=13 /DNA_END=204 /DNA_ORIENTATION=-